MTHKPIMGSMLPDPHEIIDGVKESVQGLADPLGVFEDETAPTQSRELIEVMDDMEYAVSKKNFTAAEELIEEGRESTNCGWCQNKLNRAEIDVQYANGVCRVGTEDECNAGARIVSEKIGTVATTLKKATEATENEMNGD